MKTSRPSDRLIVMRYIGSVDCAEVLFSIIKLYVENMDRSCSKNSGRQGG